MFVFVRKHVVEPSTLCSEMISSGHQMTTYCTVQDSTVLHSTLKLQYSVDKVYHLLYCTELYCIQENTHGIDLKKVITVSMTTCVGIC